MKRISFSFSLALLVLFTSQCSKNIQFSGLKHTPLGKAKLRAGQNLVVTNLGSQERDGVAVDLGKAASWIADLSFINDTPAEVKLEVFGAPSANEPVKSLSTMTLTLESERAGIVTRFPTPTNDLMLYSNDSLIHSLSGVPSATQHGTFIWVNSCHPPEFFECCPCITFGQLPQNGACFWQLHTDQDFIALDTEQGRVAGNRLVLPEHFDTGQGIGSMIFSQMRITAANLDTLLIFSERVTRRN